MADAMTRPAPTVTAAPPRVLLLDPAIEAMLDDVGLDLIDCTLQLQLSLVGRSLFQLRANADEYMQGRMLCMLLGAGLRPYFDQAVAMIATARLPYVPSASAAAAAKRSQHALGVRSAVKAVAR